MKNTDVSLKITKQDKSLLDNLVRILGRAKIELEGMEIIVAADSMRWIAGLQKRIEIEDNRPPMEIISTEPIKEEKAIKTTKPRSKKAE